MIYFRIWTRKRYLSITATFCICVCLWTHLASCFSASAQSSSSPMSTADTSMYGSQTVKPRPIRSMAVRRMVLWGGSLGLGGCSSRKVSALPANSRNSRIRIKSKRQQLNGTLWRSNLQQCYRKFYVTNQLLFHNFFLCFCCKIKLYHDEKRLKMW